MYNVYGFMTFPSVYTFLIKTIYLSLKTQIADVTVFRKDAVSKYHLANYIIIGPEPVAGCTELGFIKEEFLEVKLECEDETETSLNDYHLTSTKAGREFVL